MGYTWVGKVFVMTVATLALFSSVQALPANSTQQPSGNSMQALPPNNTPLPLDGSVQARLPNSTQLPSDSSVKTLPANSTQQPSENSTSTGEKYKFTTYISAFEQVDKGKEDDKVEIHVCKGDEVVGKPKHSKGFVEKLKQFGSGRTENGTWYNVVQSASKEHPNGCYARVKFALGDSGNSLTVYTSAAIKGLELGTLVEIEELKGKKMNAKQPHNGCVMVTGNYVDEGSVNLWVYSAAQQKEYFSELPSTVTVKQDTGCKIDDYYYSIDPSKTIGKR